MYRVSVHDQLLEVADDLRLNLFYVFTHEINIEHWRDTGHMDINSLYEVRVAISEAFENIERRWETVSDVFAGLRSCCLHIKEASFVALDLPYPVELYEFLERVISNIDILFTQIWVPRLEKIMTPAHHHIQVIQRNWVKAYTDPKHPVCRRRLLRQFSEMQSDLERVLV
jgi:hypothetical protein